MSLFRVKAIFIFFIFFHWGTISVIAQESINDEASIFSTLGKDSIGEGKIVLNQDPSLYLLIEKHARLNESNGLEGFRIQIFSASGQTARDHATTAEEKFIENFPEFDPDLIYIEYPAPFFKVRVGDYRTKSDAIEFYQKVKKYFPDSYIVRSTINFPKLDTDENPGGQK